MNESAYIVKFGRASSLSLQLITLLVFFFLSIVSDRPFLFCSPALNVERRRTETFVRLSNAELKFRACLMTSWHPASSVDAEHGQNHNPRRTIRIDRTARGDETKLGNEMKQTMLYLLGV